MTITNESELPDFDEMIEAVEKIKELSLRRATIELSLKKEEAELVRTVTSDPKYFMNGKAPSMSYIEGAYKYTGIDNCLLPVRSSLIEVTAELEYEKAKFYLMKDKLDIWRTISANERATLL